MTQEKSAIILTSRGDILNVTRQVLKDLDYKDLITPEGTDRCIEALQENPDALLLVDWAYGTNKAIKVLQYLRLQTKDYVD